MKKLFYFFLAFTLPVAVFAQPVIDSAESYHIGQHFHYMYCSPVLPGPAGASQTWDFTSIADSALGVVDVYSSLANPAIDSIDLDGGASTYNLKISDTQTTITNINLGVASIAYTPPVLLVKHPLVYLDTATGTFSDIVTVPPDIPGTGTSAMKVDGYGTLKTPQATFANCLRVRSSHSEHDSSAFAEEFVDFISYLWYDSTHKFALMRIDSVIGTGSLPISQVTASYFTTDTPTAVRNVPVEKASGTAHFDNNGLVLKTDLAQGHQYKIGLLNMSGQVVYINTFTATSGIEHFNINNEMPVGTYFLSVSEVNGKTPPLTVKVLKQ